MTFFQILGLCVFSNFRYSSKCFVQMYRAQHRADMLLELFVLQTWQPENSVNIWNLLWLSRRLII